LRKIVARLDAMTCSSSTTKTRGRLRMSGMNIPLSPIVSPISHLLHKQLFGGFVGP
jgi:hypothetical protein